MFPTLLYILQNITMAKKLTKRKAFNFLRSYFDLLNELETDSDKLQFLLSIINKQFLDENPNGLNFVVNLCYESQRHVIEKSVKGYKDKTKQDLLGNPLQDPCQDPCQDPTEGCTEGPCQQEKEKEKEKVISIDFDKLIEIYNSIYGRQIRVIPAKAKKQIRERLKEGYTKTDFVTALENAKNDQYHKDNNYKYITLEFISRPDKFERYSSNHNYKVQSKIL